MQNFLIKSQLKLKVTECKFKKLTSKKQRYILRDFPLLLNCL